MKIAQNRLRKNLISFCFLSTLICSFGTAQLYAADTVQKVKDQMGDREKAKSTIHKAVDSVDEKAVHQKIDEMAEALDPEKLKAAVDWIADSFEPEKLKRMIDLVSQCIDRDKVKAFIDEAAKHYDLNQVKQVASEIIRHIDKDAVKSKLDEKVDQVADSLEKARGIIQDEMSQFGSNIKMVQQRLNQYEWKQYIPERATSGVASLSDLRLNGHRKVVVARPGEPIKAQVICDYDRDECSALKVYRVVVGIKNKGAQVSIGKHIGLRAGKELEEFEIMAPKDPGIYEIGFKTVQAAFESDAMHEWNEGSNSQIRRIGLIIVH